MNLKFTVNNQILKIETEEELELYNYNYNQYNCIFSFNTDEESLWKDVDKFVIFRDSWDNACTVHLGEGDVCECLIPSVVLNGTFFRVALYGGDLVSTNNVSLPLLMSGYIDPNNPDYIQSWVYGIQKDIFVEIFKHLNITITNISYDNKCLNLYTEKGLADSIYLPLVTEDESRTIARDIVEEFFHEIPIATTENDGLLSHNDKQKLDNVDERLSNISTVGYTGEYNDLLNIPSDFNPKQHEHYVVDVVDYDDNIDLDLNTLLDRLSDEISKE